MKYIIPLIFLLTACGQGPQGVPGPKGDKGDTGQMGPSCTVEQAYNGALIKCPDGSNVLVLNGTNGQNGLDGKDGKDAETQAYSISEIIDPCGDKTNEFDEILIRLYNGTIIAYFEDNGHRFLAEVTPGSYQTTDKQKCQFTVHTDLTVTW